MLFGGLWKNCLCFVTWTGLDDGYSCCGAIVSCIVAVSEYARKCSPLGLGLFYGSIQWKFSCGGFGPKTSSGYLREKMSNSILHVHQWNLIIWLSHRFWRTNIFCSDILPFENIPDPINGSGFAPISC